MEAYWKGRQYAFFQHRQCEFFPCHPTGRPEDFNCLFCYCPLYCLGERCGGAYTYLENGIKDCSRCALPHQRDNYGYVMEQFQQVAEVAKRKENC